jgi:hypothetical protein
VFEVLKPLEVGAGNTSTVSKKIRCANDTTANKDFFGGKSSGSVGTFKDTLDHNLLSIHLVEGLLNSSGDKEIGLFLHEESGVFNFSLLSSGETNKGALLGHPNLNSLNIETSWVVNSGVVFNNSRDNTLVLLEEVSSPVADSAETLDDEGFILNSKSAVYLLAVILVGKQFTDAVVYTETSGLSTTSDTSLSDELASAAALSVDVLFTLNVHVGVLDPSHNLLVGSHIGTKAIYGSTDETLLDELHSVLAGYTLKFGLRKKTGVDLDTSLASTEWNIGDSEFEGHKAGEGLNFLKIDVIGVSGSSLAG